MMLILVVGPSGAGKDTLLGAAKQRLGRDPRFRFVRRVITRAAEAGGEDHEAVSEAEFLQRRFALQWQAHGLHYGIPADIAGDLRSGVCVVASVSRGVIEEASRRFPVRVLEVTAPASVLAGRLRARGREGEADIALRLSRLMAIPDGVMLETIQNHSTIAEGAERFVAALLRHRIVTSQPLK